MVSVLTRPRTIFLVLTVVGVIILTHALFSPIVQESRKNGRLLKDASSYFRGAGSESEDLPLKEGEEEAWVIPYNKTGAANLQIANGTLGFQSIFVLGLPDRLLKRDGMELAASITNLTLTWEDGVLGDKMHPNAVPPYHDNPYAGFFKTDGELGCWRGHMNIVHRMVRDRVASALVMEDDADWDIHIVQEMQKFAEVSREYLKEDPNNTWQRKRRGPTGSPYGENWDILWIGHCGGWPAEDGNNHIAVVHNDSTVPPTHIHGQLFGVNNKTEGTCAAHEGSDPKDVVCDSPRLKGDERLIQERTKPLCTTGYAISLQGARKMLARIGGLSLLDVTAPIDWEMIEMCKQTGRPGVDREASRCLTVSPPYIRSHRAKGPISGDSDIEGHTGNKGNHEVGLSKGLKYPARLNVENLISGYEPETQYIQEADGSWRFKLASEYRSKP